MGRSSLSLTIFELTRYPRFAIRTDWLHVFALSGVAVAQPLYGLVAPNAEFLVAHHAAPRTIVALVLGISAGIPLALVAAQAVARLFGSRARYHLHTATVAVLLALTFAGLAARAALPDLAAIAVAVLAGGAWWFPDATAAASHTTSALPAIVTGVEPTAGLIPIAADYPRNLFTWLSPSHTLHVLESVTTLCPAALCAQAETDRRLLLRDVGILYLHVVTPRDLAARRLPPVSSTWKGFGQPTPAPVVDTRPSLDMMAKFERSVVKGRDGIFREFVAGIRGDEQPDHLHELLRHRRGADVRQASRADPRARGRAAGHRFRPHADDCGCLEGASALADGRGIHVRGRTSQPHAPAVPGDSGQGARRVRRARGSAHAGAHPAVRAALDDALSGDGAERSIGARVSDLHAADGDAAERLVSDSLVDFRAVDPASGFLPAIVHGYIEGYATERPSIPIAVALNGTVRAVTRTTRWSGADNYFAVLLPESAVQPGRNIVEVFEMDPRAEPIALRRISSGLAAGLELAAGGKYLTAADGTHIPFGAGIEGWVDRVDELPNVLRLYGWAADRSRCGPIRVVAVSESGFAGDVQLNAAAAATLRRFH